MASNTPERTSPPPSPKVASADQITTNDKSSVCSVNRMELVGYASA